MNLIVKKYSELTTDELYEILKSRTEVFLLEQKIICQDLDDIDKVSTHFYFMENNRVAAYLRAFYDKEDKSTVRVGRVLTLRHNEGVGRKLMEMSICEIKNRFNAQRIEINSQKQAVGFYEKFDFQIISGEFLEEGVIHLKMELKL